MLIIGDQILDDLRRGNRTSAKFIVNEAAAAFFDISHQHKDQRFPGLSYAEDYKGNALAGTVSEKRLDIRFHEKFSDERVRNIIKMLLLDARLLFMGQWTVYYQGCTIRN